MSAPLGARLAGAEEGARLASTEQGAATRPGSDQAEPIDYARQVQPILAKRCYSCHGPDEAESGLSFAEQESAFAEADSGERAIVPGDLDASALIARLTSDDEYERMPPEGKPLQPAEIEVIRAWILQGAKWSKHWAFQPMQKVSPPTVADPRWNENPIDAFLFETLAKRKLKPNPPASRATLIRRAYYDLTGLPPTAQQVQDFVSDPDPLAFEKLIDQLLDSPHYGERWGRHWLDLVRYAETNSFERDGAKPNAYKYRDYVIKSFNDDKPYDQFIREQLAGDELDEVNQETLTATGYYRLGIWDDEPADPLLAVYDGMDDIIMTTGQVFLGLTFNCARCHDHKIDPIPQADYYSLLAFMADVTPWGTRANQRENNQIDVSSPELNAKYQANDEAKRQLEKELRELEQLGIAKMSAPDQRATEGPRREREKVLKAKLKDHLDAEQWASYRQRKKELAEVVTQAKQLPPREMIMGLARCNPRPKPTYVLFRGNPHSPADQVQPAFPGILGGQIPELPEVQDTAKTAGRRVILANWIASPENLMTARVMANRLWQFHFGRGIVRSSNNFGQLGTPPTHPELLDWLGHRLIEGGWRLKSMHRLIMTSKAYQLSSATGPAAELDPNNDLFWRFNPRRLSAEEVRYSILSANGSLNRRVYGPSFYPKLSREVLAGQSRPGAGWGKSSEQDQNRRSVYIHVKRSLLTPLLSAFDFPDPDLTCEDRFATLQPGQALSLLNSEFIHRQAERLANHVGADELANDQVVRRTIESVLARSASPEEIQDGVKLIEDLESKHGLGRSRAVQLYCMTVMNWNEFLFID
ncbi:MAG: PSD1 and planctomycete cytochrome C domain-containing protein [Pirellulales bacterium]|nr:PSD1 and planctomycete cytochrome C domain-containing protein [Pirellulales bacterium]